MRARLGVVPGAGSRIRPVDADAADVRDQRTSGVPLNSGSSSVLLGCCTTSSIRPWFFLMKAAAEHVRTRVDGNAHFPLSRLPSPRSRPLAAAGPRRRFGLAPRAARLGLRLLRFFVGLRGRLRRRLRDVEQRDAPAVERDLELLVRHAVADVDAVDGAHQVDADEVLRVEREEVLDAQPPRVPNGKPARCSACIRKFGT